MIAIPHEAFTGFTREWLLHIQSCLQWGVGRQRKLHGLSFLCISAIRVL